MTTRRWIKAHWPEDPERDVRFDGFNGAVAELRREGEPAGHAMMEVRQWATIEGHLWWKRVTGVRTLPELHLAYWDPVTAAQRDFDWPTWFAHDVDEASAMYEECVAGLSLTWEGVRYDVQWLGESETAAVRADLFWEPDAE